MALMRIDPNPSTRQLTVFAVLWLVVLGYFGYGYQRDGHGTVAYVLWGAALLVPLAGLVSRAALRGVYLAACHAAAPFGFVLSVVLLAIVYYLVLTPVGLVLRLFRPDPLQRGFDPDTTSYWQRRGPARGKADYFKQH